MGVPVIDIAGFEHGAPSDRAVVGEAVDAACREFGFFSVVGHGVAPDVIEDAHELASRFFELPLDDRLSVAPPTPTHPYGYRAMSAEALNRSLGGSAPPDLKETFNVGPVDAPPRPLDQMDDADERAVYAANLWPESLPELRPALERYYRAMADLAHTLMDSFSVALGLGDGWFDRFIDRHGAALRLAHYPAMPTPPPEGALRAGAHTDYGTLTILRLDAEPGLEIQRGDRWIPVAAPDGALVVNLGDLMERWTNDRWRSTMHRVVVPAGAHDRERLTIPFFHNANWDARVESIGDEPSRYPVVSAGAHLMEKFRATVVG